MFRVLHPNRWFFWAVALLLIAGLFLLVKIYDARLEFEEFASQFAIDSLSYWKTFRSRHLGISIQYPADWQIEIDPETGAVSFENPKNFNENIAIYVVKPALEPAIRNTLSIAEERDIVLDGAAGKWLLSKNNYDPATSNVILIKRGESLYYIAGNAKAFEKILGSIKFLP